MELEGDRGTKWGVLHGSAIGFGFRSSVEWELQEGVLSEIRLDSQPILVEIGVIHRPDQPPSAFHEAFGRYLSDQLYDYLARRNSVEGASDEGPLATMATSSVD